MPDIRLEYKDNDAFNAYVDGANEQVKIFDLIYLPSEVLFAVDPEAYRDLLAGYGSEETVAEIALAVEGTGTTP